MASGARGREMSLLPKRIGIKSLRIVREGEGANDWSDLMFARESEGLKDIGAVRRWR